ncbi:hypothetical protein ISS05_05560 [Candidatus Woesearchaeota archaeon]|nr:hypothetical protein [Candidatus Woesearchaeota archaeon]
MAWDKNELSKLPLRERIRRLKQLEKNRKKEIDEIDNLIKDSQKELSTEEIAEEISPESKEVDISKLFGSEEEDLEGTVKKEAPAEETEEAGESRYLSLQQAVDDYEELRGLGYNSIGGGLSENQMEAIDQIGERLDRTKYTSASREVANLVVASRAVLYKIKKYAGLDNNNF